MNAEWRNYAKPEEIAEHDGLIAVDRANAARRRLIRNRCNMRKKQAAKPTGSALPIAQPKEQPNG